MAQQAGEMQVAHLNRYFLWVSDRTTTASARHAFLRRSSWQEYKAGCRPSSTHQRKVRTALLQIQYNTIHTYTRVSTDLHDTNAYHYYPY